MKNNWSKKMILSFNKVQNIDPYLKYILIKYGLPKDRSVPNNFQTLVRIIVGQQISKVVADSIFNKLLKKNYFLLKIFLKLNNLFLEKLDFPPKKLNI